MTKETPTIKASLTLFGKVYKSSGKTVEEVIDKLNPPVAKGVGVLRLEKGELVREKILNGRIINGTFGQRSPTMRNLAIKNITTLFNDFN